MALTKTTFIERTRDALKNTLLFLDSAGRSSPGVALVDDSGDQLGVTGNPLLVGMAAGAGAATEAAQGTAQVATVSGSVASYAGAEIEVTGFAADTPYSLVSIAYQLLGGTALNTTQPSIGEASGFTQGSMGDRYKISGTIDKDVERTVDNLVQPIPVISDANGKLYIKGASPAVADSTLYWRVDLHLERSV